MRFLAERRDELLTLTGQHLVLVLVSVAIAVALGIPLGIAMTRSPRLARTLLGLASLAQTIPSLALFGFLIPVPYLGGVGARTAVVALVLYALLPILRNTYTGIRQVDRAVVEAATGLGMTEGQRLRMVELPLALPVILAGVRIAAVVSVGTATIAAAIGAGGLGTYVFRGLATVDTRLVLAGRSSAGRPVVVGSKNFTEQVILGELLAAHLEARGHPVDRRLNLGGTALCHEAVRSGRLDVYVEYTGTALTDVLKRPPASDPAAVLETVRTGYRGLGLEVGEPLGFDNTFALVMQRARAQALGITKISDLATHAGTLRVGLFGEFLERADGLPGLLRVYGFRLAVRPREMDLGLLYPALLEDRVDVVVGSATDGLIAARDLVVLEDDRHYFPPYDAVPVMSGTGLIKHPGLSAALRELAGRIDATAMRKMNYAVDGEHRAPREVAREFLAGMR